MQNHHTLRVQDGFHQPVGMGDGGKPAIILALPTIGTTSWVMDLFIFVSSSILQLQGIPWAISHPKSTSDAFIGLKHSHSESYQLNQALHNDNSRFRWVNKRFKNGNLYVSCSNVRFGTALIFRIKYRFAE